MKKCFVLSLLLIGLLVAVLPVTAQAPRAVMWLAEYYNGRNFNAPAVVRAYEPGINYNWGLGAPSPGVVADNFSVRWTTTTYFEGGLYRFQAQADDEIRITIDNTQIILNTLDAAQPGASLSADVNLSQGFHNVRVEYRENGGAAYVSMSWQQIQAPIPSPAPGVWVAEYYNNRVLDGTPAAILSESSPSHNWGSSAPLSSVSADNFSVRWHANLALDGAYMATVRADDGVRVLVNGVRFIDEWHGARGDTYSAVFNVPPGLHTITIEYYEEAGLAFMDFNLSRVGDMGGLWRAEYYSNRDLSGTPAASEYLNSPTIDWGAGSPLAAIPADDFSARFSSTQRLESGTYRLDVNADDGVRVTIDGQRVIDEWHLARAGAYQAEVPLLAGDHSVVIDYYERGGDAFLYYQLTRIGDYSTQPAPGVTTATVTANRLNLRAEPSSQAVILGRLHNNERYPVLGRSSDGTWWQIQVGETVGWVYGHFVRIDEPGIVPATSQASTPSVPLTPYDLTATATVRIRSNPTTRAAILDQLPRGASADIVARNALSTWWRISYNGLVGWVSADYVRLPSNLNLSQIPVQ